MAAKRTTKKATKNATPKRKASTPKKQQATQLQVMAEANEFLGKRHKGMVVKMDSLDNTVPGYVSSQSLALDWIIGNGGFPMSRIWDITGDEGVGKSTVGDHLMAEIQRVGGHCYLWDTENARDDRYQENIGIIRKRASQILAHTMEDGFAVMLDIVSWYTANDPGRPGFILWDTPAGTPTKDEVDPEKKASPFGPAKLIREQLRLLNQQLQQGKWIFGVVNQTYMGKTARNQAVQVAYGGGGIPYYSSVRLQCSHPKRFWRTASDKEIGFPPLGQTVWVRCVKNRVGMPWRSKQICIQFGQGISNVWEVFQELVKVGAIKNNKGHCSFDPDYDQTLYDMYPKSFQASVGEGGHLKFEALVMQIEGMWERLLEVYHEIDRGEHA